MRQLGGARVRDLRHLGTWTTLTYDVVCLSHLRWDFVYQRPQHLLSRFARTRRVFFIEEPLPLTGGSPHLEVSPRQAGLQVVVPRLPAHLTAFEADRLAAELLRAFFEQEGVRDFVLWYYTPMALGTADRLPPALATVYDCMDELSAFRGAPPELLLREAELLQRADLLFTGGPSLYEAKRRQHGSVHLFPSSVDVEHFAQARQPLADPPDQASVPRPRLGFFGVLDERLDTDLLAGVAELRPAWQLVLVGPLAKIEPSALPRRPNIHYLGQKPYAELPQYLAGWDVALLPFARNAATRFISPTKTPEYLAAGRPVVSTSIADVVRPYGEQGLVRIADEPEGFVSAVEAALAEEQGRRRARADAFLAGTSWELTWSAMDALVGQLLERRLDAAAARAAG
jgi:glycosyltransferase involved in cell wall biosynthesis